jgi:hypothetical protein
MKNLKRGVGIDPAEYSMIAQGTAVTPTRTEVESDKHSMIVPPLLKTVAVTEPVG